MREVLPAKLLELMRMVRIEHTLFALPFAFLGMLLAAGGLPSGRTVLWIVVAMTGARSAAMTFNRILDRRLDARNPRTAGRTLPAGRLSVRFAWGFLLAGIAAFVGAATLLNRTCLLLTPVALAVLLGYSLTKRLTLATHFVLGLALAGAPAGAWIAVREDFTAVPFWLGLSVLLWVAGFDILYSCQDVEFDRAAGLHSIPARIGIPLALLVSRALHAACLLSLLVLHRVAGLGAPFLAGIGVAAALLLWAQWIVRPGDLRRVNTAFFTAQSLVSLSLLAAAALDLFLRGEAPSAGGLG